MTAVWDDGWSTGREHDVALVAHATGSRPSEVRNMHPATLRDMVDSVQSIVGRKGRSPEQIARDQALENLHMADRLDAQGDPARDHSQLCPCWRDSNRGQRHVHLERCNCWRKQQLLTTVATFREAGWRWVG